MHGETHSMTTVKKSHRMLHPFSSIKGRSTPPSATKEKIKHPTNPSKFGNEFPIWQLIQTQDNIPFACYPVRDL